MRVFTFFWRFLEFVCFENGSIRSHHESRKKYSELGTELFLTFLTVRCLQSNFEAGVLTIRLHIYEQSQSFISTPRERLSNL